MPERFARLAAVALIAVLILAVPLLFLLFTSAPQAAPTPAPTISNTIALPTATRIPPTETPLPSATLPPTVTALPTPTAGCPNPGTPEPLWVNPVVSPTNLLVQEISVMLGRGREISITGERGTVTQQGQFSVAQPVTIQVPLAPNTLNRLLVTGRIEYAPNCFYTLQTRVDRTGHPLEILQTAATPIVTPTLIPTPPAPGTVYIKPFSQVFGLNQDEPNASEQIWLYEANADAPFQIMEQRGAFTRVSSQGGNLNFWTLNENATTLPAPEAVIENVAEQPVELVPGKVFACEGRAPRGLILGACQELQDVGAAVVLQRAIVENSRLYLVRYNYQTYWVSSNVLRQEPP